MKITDIEIRACRHKDPVMKDSEMRDGKKSELEFLVITFHTDEGLSTSTFGFAVSYTHLTLPTILLV